MKRARYAAVFIYSCTFAWGAVPLVASADTAIGPDAEISESVTWTKGGSPYIVQGSLTVNVSTTLTIEPGVIVQFESDSWMDVLGTLLAQGTAEDPIHFLSEDESRWGGLQFENQNTASSLDHVAIRYARTGITDYYSKDLSLSNISITDGEYGIEAAGSHLSVDTLTVENMSDEALDIRDRSDVALSNLTLKNVEMSVQIYTNSVANISNLLIDGASGEALAVYVGSHVRVASSTIKNVSNSYGAVEAFIDSSLDISGLTLENVSDGDALSVFDNSQITVRDSSILHTDNYEVASAFSSGTFIFKQMRIVGGTGDGMAVFGGGSIDMQDSAISDFTNGAGIADYGSRPDQPANYISLTRNEITGNAVGIGLYSDKSTYSISNNSIHSNATNGLESYGTAPVDVSNNYWGDASGPHEDPDNLTGIGNGISFDPAVSAVVFSPWLTSDPLASDPCAIPGACASNVLFLPGIEGSRLYRPDYDGGTDKLWEPNIDSDVQDLYMNADGSSARPDIYTKERDVIDELPSGENIYKSFIGKMDELKTSDTITDWEPIAYDWRLSLDDILSYGHDIHGRIYYAGDLRATSTPYVIQELKRLAASSKTGKVTIVAHSNGGLLAKQLTELLGPTESARLIDQMIFVAVPQAGTPAAIAAGMHGFGQDHVFGLVTSKSTARTLASGAPMEYQLLPSEKYFTYVDDPVVTFDDTLTDWVSRYGNTVHSQERLHQFLADTFGRVDPQTGNISQPIQLDDTLLASAEALHTSLDTWVPPSGVELTQIAGWGVPKTVSGITYKKKGTGVTPEMDFTIDGDGTVVTPSALWTSTTTGAANYWVDLASWNRRFANTVAFGLLDTNHGNIFEVPDLEQLVSDQISNTTKPISDYGCLSTEAPIASGKRLRYALHSPLTLNLYDAQGRHTGVSTTTGQVEEQIPGTYYVEFGDVKYLFSDVATGAQVIMNGYDTGTFTLNIDEYAGNDLSASTAFKDVPTTASTVVSLSVQSDISTLSPMVVDENGDGSNVITMAPKIGETVIYEPPMPEPVQESHSNSGGGGGGWSPSPIPVPVAITPSPTSTPRATTTSVIASTTQVVANSAPARQKVAVMLVNRPKKVSVSVAQTASVYEASQQPLLTKWGAAVYNGLYEFWSALKRLF